MNCREFIMNRPSDNPRARNLRALLAGEAADAPPDLVITDLTLDSRSVQPGGAFVALPGTRTHGDWLCCASGAGRRARDSVGTGRRRCSAEDSSDTSRSSPFPS